MTWQRLRHSFHLVGDACLVLLVPQPYQGKLQALLAEYRVKGIVFERDF